MLKRKNDVDEINGSQGPTISGEVGNDALLRAAPKKQDGGILENLMSGYSKVQIEDPIRPFHESELKKIKVNYGVLEVLQGTWVSYNNSSDDQSKRKLNGTGIHTTIMPSPGTNSGNIPGKYSFECEEYIEKLTFNLVPGGVRNRGGGNEQFCGAVKYEQSIKSVNKVEGKADLEYTPIHEENGMYLWLSDIFNYAASKETIEKDRGIHPLEPNDPNRHLYKGDYQDEALYQVLNKFGIKEYVTLENLNGRDYFQILPAKDLKPGAGQTGPYFIPDYSISRSGVIPHGSTITLLGDVARNSGYISQGAPIFPRGVETWNFDHLSISPTMGGAGAKEAGTPGSIKNPPINLDEAPPAWVFEKLNNENDPGENRIYTQRILAHDLYPYSVRPDLRLRDSLNGENVTNYVQIKLSSKNKTGAQGGILNVPFVNRFVPTVEMNMNMWIETVIEDGREILQLQYEQIIFFEFHFGDDGGTTSWPHIQVNTLRKIEDVSGAQRTLIEEQFPEANSILSSAPASGCPYNK